MISLANEIANYKIKIIYDWIMNNPYDTEESLKEAFSIILQLINCTIVTVFI